MFGDAFCGEEGAVEIECDYGFIFHFEKTGFVIGRFGQKYEFVK